METDNIAMKSDSIAMDLLRLCTSAEEEVEGVLGPAGLKVTARVYVVIARKTS